MNSRKNEIYQKDLQLKDSKTKKANNVIYIQNIEGSQEKTVFELISDQTTEIKINNNITITTSESFEPSIADEVNYDPQNTTNELDFIEANLDVNEGTNEHNFNLVNKIKESQIKQIQVLSNSKFLKTYNRTSNLNIGKLLSVKRNCESVASQQGLSLNNFAYTQKPEIISTDFLSKTAASVKCLNTKPFSNKFAE